MLNTLIVGQGDRPGLADALAYLLPDMALVKGKIVRCHNRLVNQIEKI